MVYEDFFSLLNDPLSLFDDGQFTEGSVKSTIIIVMFHLHHLIIDWNKMSMEDKIHHFISALLVGTIALYFECGKGPAFINMAMCGFPGSIDYYMLFFVKNGIIDKIKEKRFNRYFNLCIRYPIALIICYITYLNIRHEILIMNFNGFMYLFGLILQTLNTIYYTDKVIGNYYMRRYKDDQNHKRVTMKTD